MAIVMYAFANQITQVSGYNYLAELQYGSDGQMLSGPELDAGAMSGRKGQYVTWDGYPENGTDSGWLTAQATLQAGTNGLSWMTSNAATPIKLNAGTIAGIRKVDIRAAVQTQASMLWQDVTLQFYKNGALTETVPLSNFGVDKTGAPGIQQEIVSIQPAQADNNKVVISGQFRLTCPDWVYPDSYDMFSQVLMYLGTGTRVAGTTSQPLQTTSSSDSATPAALFSSEPLATQDPPPDLMQGDDPSVLI